MGTGAITEYMDVAQLALYVFWIFFFGWCYISTGKASARDGLCRCLRVNCAQGGWYAQTQNLSLAHGQGERVKPGPEPAQYEVNATPIYDASGAPMHPNGDPMVDGVGAAAWAIRPDKPDLTVDGRPRIVPSAGG
jgi:photosynthetic reaction center H subunit